MALNKLSGEKNDYISSIKKLFPKGQYWDAQFDNPESDLSVWAEASADEVFNFKSRFDGLIKESTPKTAKTTIEDWERVLLGRIFPDLPVEQRRNFLTIKKSGNINKDMLQKIAGIYGTTIEISFPFRPGFFGRSKFAQERLCSCKAFSAIFIDVYNGEKLNSTKEFEKSIENSLLANNLVYFVYRIHQTSGIKSISDLINTVKVNIDVSQPYHSAKFGLSKFAITKISSPLMDQVRFVRISNYSPTNRRKDIESSVKRILPDYFIIYFLYNKEIYYGRNVS